MKCRANAWAAAWLLIALAPAARAGDKIGNGGGLWTCYQGTTLKKAELVDLFEARTEFQASTPDSFVGTTAKEVYDQKKAWIATTFPALFAQVSPSMSYVEAHLTVVDAQLTLINDSLFRIEPTAESCMEGTWSYTQFANFTEYGNVLVRKDLWESPGVPALDKAALLVHEGVSKWLRDTYQDANSVRARQIVGLLFSNLGTADVGSRIQALLAPETPQPATPKPTPKLWACLLITTNDAKYTYLGYGETQLSAEISVARNCQYDHQNDGNPCMGKPICEQESDQDRTCYLKDTSSQHAIYEGHGKSLTEATAGARQSCQYEFSSAGRYCQGAVKCE